MYHKYKVTDINVFFLNHFKFVSIQFEMYTSFQMIIIERKFYNIQRSPEVTLIYVHQLNCNKMTG